MEAFSRKADGFLDKARLAAAELHSVNLKKRNLIFRKDDKFSIITLHEIHPVETSRKRSTIDELI